MQDVVIALLIGLILGWIIEWLIDWRYWRATVATLRQENAQLRRQLDAITQAEEAAQTSVSSTIPTKTQGR